MANRAAGAEWESIVAVAAHGLLSPMAVITGFAELLARHWDTLDPAAREQYLGKISSNARLVTGMLEDLVRGLPPDVREMLDALDAQTARRYGERES